MSDIENHLARLRHFANAVGEVCDCDLNYTANTLETLYRENADLRKQLEQAEDWKTKYHELLFAVGQKFPDETRHQTALRYIRRAETGNNIAYCTTEQKDDRYQELLEKAPNHFKPVLGKD